MAFQSRTLERPIPKHPKNSFYVGMLLAKIKDKL
jgi:hypothetical protein